MGNDSDLLLNVGLHDAIDDLRAENERLLGLIASVKAIDIVFDGPPSHESGRFVEVENMVGASINVGTWIDRGDGLWALRVYALVGEPEKEVETVRVPVSVTRRTDDEGTISLDACGFTTVRLCRHCGVLVAGGPTACMACVRYYEALARELEADDRWECLGHPAGPYDPMGQMVYCDGSCRRVRGTRCGEEE